MDQSFKGFAAATEATVDRFARSKGYTTDGPGQGDVADEILRLLDLREPHGTGEIILKLLEYRHSPRRVLLEKIAGYAYMLWRECEEP